MPESTIIANYIDPVYTQLKNEFGQQSDAFPIAMLPVRLETRFMNETRYVTMRVPGQTYIDNFVNKSFVLIRDLMVWENSIDKFNVNKNTQKLRNYRRKLDAINAQITKVTEVDGDDKRILRDTAEDILQAINQISYSPLASQLASFKALAQVILSYINQLNGLSQSVYKKGYDYLASLEAIEDSVAAIYVKHTVNSQNVDMHLDNIDAHINRIYKLIQDSDFKATTHTAGRISSKISFIKRLQKNSYVRLLDFRIGYTGNKNLQSYEYALRGDINALKLKIDQEHVPYIQLLEELKRYPIRRLIYRMTKATFFLKAKNQMGYAGYNSLMETKKELYKHLRSIRERAHRPLSGNFADISTLKSKYAGLESEIQKFITKSDKIKSTDTYRKAALTRLETHLRDEYLEDLKDLLPGLKTVEEQTFVDSKIRTTSTAAYKSGTFITQTRDAIKNISASGQAGLLQMQSQLQALKAQIAVSSTNTILLPTTLFSQLQAKLNSLKSHMTNFVLANSIHESNSTLAQNNALLSDIENYINDQHLDIIDKRDWFYDSYRKKITFILKTQTVKELWVRIYPDDIAVDNHDERLTDEEEKIGQDYYYEVYSKIESLREEAKLPAWRAVASSLGVRRAAYVLKVLEPTEVKNDSVVEYNSSIRPIVEDFKDQLKQPLRKAVAIYIHRTNKFKDLVANLDQTMQRALGNNFTICLQNKNLIDELFDLFKKIANRLNKEFQDFKDPATRQLIDGQIAEMKAAAAVMEVFYKAHLEQLNQPYRPELNFGIIEKKTKSWDRAGITEVMPDRFVVVTKRNKVYQHIVTGNQITKPLQLSIDPSGDQADRFSHLPNGDLEVPEEMRWLFDFDAAVDAGMGVRIPLQDDDFESGFDFVMAYGVQNTTAQEGQETLNKLLTNHLYSDGGLEYLHVGTATNNTEDVKSPYTGLDNDVDGAFELFINAESPQYSTINTDTEISITDGQFFKDALGLPENIANYIRHHEKMDIANGRAMNRALYNATIKYYMNLMVDDLLTDNDKDKTVEFMMRNLSAVGTVPSFRVDKQPYGVLPITNYKSFLADGNTTKGTEGSYLKTLTMFLRQTRLAFEEFTKKPQTVNGPAYAEDPQAQFLKILGLEPYSKEFYYRYGANISGRLDEGDELDFPINWDNATGAQVPANIAENYVTLLKELGYHNATTRKYAIEKTRAYTNRYFQANYIKGDLVQNHNLGTEKLANITSVANFEGNYIDWLYQNNNREDLNPLIVEDIPAVDGDIQNSLLFMMLRGGLLYDNSSYALRTFPVLSSLDVLTLERLLANHIDLCTYRLDAWMGGLSNYRLTKQRATQPTGTYIGAYGFVADLKPEPPKVRVQNLPEGLTPSDGSEVYRMPDNQGFIHGPSMNHAVAAAVLRAGFTSLKNRGNNNNALAVNLSSSRVRKALTLLEGVGNGQESGALLGYVFERALHEKYTDGYGTHLEMDTYIYRLRKKFSTFGDLPKDGDINLDELEAIKAANVVDGLAMIDHFEEQLKNQNFWDDDKTFVEMIIDNSNATPVFNGHPWSFTNQVPDPEHPPLGSTATLERLKLRAIIHELDNMADAFDALSDLMNAEGVFQLVRGNHVRASAVLNALAEGKVPLDPEIINSMRQGVMVTHRVSVNVEIPQSQLLPWPNIPLSPRAKVEHPLNCWLAMQIGNPDVVDWKATYGNTETYLTLEDLGMQPIDLVMLVATGGEESMAEIEMRCVDYLLANGASEEDEITMNFNEHSPAVQYSFGEIVSLLQHLGKVITTARAADARDYRIAEDEENFEPTSAGIDTAFLTSRLNSAISDYQTLLDSLAPFTAEKIGYTPAETTLAIEKLRELTLWGFAGFYPSREAAKDTMAMAAKIISAKAKMEQNIAFAQSTLDGLAMVIDQATWISGAAEIATKLFGNGFKLLPEFTTTNGLDLRAQLDLPQNEGILRHKAASEMNDWLGSASLVRNRLSAMETVCLLTDVQHGNAPSLWPAQLPFDDTKPVAERDYWFGTDYPDTYKPDGDRLSLVCFGHEHVGENMCGLILDEWMEIIPDEIETTGIALHYNQPDARAPQTVLLAVTPQITGNWNLDEVALTVEEAFNMAAIRAVEPEHIDYSMFSQLLPATSTLSYGFNELWRREKEKNNEDGNTADDGDDQVLGLYIDYSAVNHGYEPDEIED